MDLSRVQAVISVLNNPTKEGELFEEIGRLREQTPRTLTGVFDEVNRRAAVEQGVKAVSAILKAILQHCESPQGEPGHGSGHWCRDFAHTQLFAQDPEIQPTAVIPAIIGGTLHDIGTLFVDRWAESKRVIRHAEAGALIVRAAALETQALSSKQADLVAYCIAAHTHYLGPQTVLCDDGGERKIMPYDDQGDGGPFLPVWQTRWADRLDVNGPCFPGRHYLTLVRDHFDYGVDGFYKTSFADTLKPILRTGEEIKAAGGKRSMLEHLQMFAGSQTSASPYGKHDLGVMLTLRDAYREQLDHIIYSVAHPTEVDIERVLKAWTIFLGANIEPSEAGRLVAHNLALGFRQLEPDVQRAWACGFRTIMAEYLVWADRMLVYLNRLPAECLRIPGVFADIREVIRPNLTWVAPLVV